jgi:hypothetical protein
MITGTVKLAQRAALRSTLLPAVAASTTGLRSFGNWPKMSTGGYTEEWPRGKANMGLNVCPQGERMIVERLGRMHCIHSPGWFFAIPFIDRIAYRIDMREKAIEVLPQRAITKDNVSLEVAGNIFVEFNDPERAAYG